MKFYTKAVLIGTAALMFSTVQAKTTAKFSGRNLPSDSLAVGGAKDSTAIRGDSASVAAKADSARADSTTRFYNGKLDSLSKALDGQLRAFNLARFGKDTIFTSIPDSTVAQIGAGIQNDYDTAKARLDSLKSALDTMKQKGYAKNAKARKLKKKIAELEGTVEGVKKRAETWNVALVDTSKYSGAPDTSKTAGASPDSLRLSGLKAQFATAKAAVDSANASTIGKAGRLVRKTMKIADDESKKFKDSTAVMEVDSMSNELLGLLQGKEAALAHEYRLDSLSYALDSLSGRISAAKTAGEVTTIGDELNDISKKVAEETALGDKGSDVLAGKLANVQKQFGKKQDEMGGYSN